jgi:ribosomal protein S18 acetylase RimI-like enzyme
MIQVELALPADRAPSARVLADAFFDDPVMVWLVPDDEIRRDHSIGSFGSAFDSAVEHGHVRVARRGQGVAGVAVWYPPGKGSAAGGAEPRDADDADTATRSSASSPSPSVDVTAGRGAVIGRAMAEHHPREPHYYLQAIGVRPGDQGLGIGSSLIAPVTAVCDEEAVGAYLEATTDHSRRLYERHGFEVSGLIELPDGPVMYPMWRPPAT